MSDIAELERRITAALERIGQAIDRPTTVPVGNGSAELQEALQAERDANAQLTERLRAIKERDGDLQAKVDALTAQLDAQGLEVRRMRRNVVNLRETLKALREEQSEGVTEPHLLNKAMLAELEALRATRQSETFEMDAILAELKPLIGEVQHA